MNNPDLFKLRADLRAAIAYNEKHRRGKFQRCPKPEGEVIYLNFGDSNQ
jgi:hypothetical protein